MTGKLISAVILSALCGVPAPAALAQYSSGGAADPAVAGPVSGEALRAGTNTTPPVAPAAVDDLFASPETTSRFLASATFGARPRDLQRLTGGSASAWFRDQLALPMSDASETVDDYLAFFSGAEEANFLATAANTLSFWKLSVSAPDQLRQRMAFALSQILVVSDAGGAAFNRAPSAIAYYRDILAEHAFGNYRDLLEAVTRSPAMGYYLTYIGNQPADPETGRMPDENYAREILQLFSIGLVELNSDGGAVLDANGEPIETYDNADITGLARVFTGFDLDRRGIRRGGDQDAALYAAAGRPMVLRERLHSPREKAFLDLRIAEGTGAEESLRLALDHIVAHPNLGPFIGRQLIQRFTTSDPRPAYVAEVSAAFDRGYYVLPDETTVGDGRRGDLAATLAAVLFAAVHHGAYDIADERFGKLREPVLRFTQWARAFEVDASHPEYRPGLLATQSNSALAQHPYRAPSVFNFYRPGYVPPGTGSGEAGMTVPELQLVNASSTPGYMNFMTRFVFADSLDRQRVDAVERRFTELGLPFDRSSAAESFVPGYQRELALADDPEALVAHLDLLLAQGELEPATRSAIRDFIADIPLRLRAPDGRLLRVSFAVLMTLTAPEYLVQR